MASSASTSQNVTSSQIRYSESLNLPDADIEILSRLGETPEKSQYGFRLHKNVLVANLRAFADMIDLGSESEGSTASVTLPEEGPDLERLFSFVYAARLPSYTLSPASLSLVGTEKKATISNRLYACRGWLQSTASRA